MARILNGSHSFTCIPRVDPLTEWTILAFAFPAKAGPHLPTLDGWKAELTLGGRLHTEINVRHRELNPDTVTHLSTNRARRWLTSLIETNPLTTTPLLCRQCYSASSWTHPKVLRYGTRSQGISQFYLHTPRSSANGLNHTCLKLPFQLNSKAPHSKMGEGVNRKKGLGERHYLYSARLPDEYLKVNKFWKRPISQLSAGSVGGLFLWYGTGYQTVWEIRPSAATSWSVHWSRAFLFSAYSCT